MQSASRDNIKSEINVTPFLDVLLVMIIIFLASMTTRKTLDAQLPTPCAGTCAGSEIPIVLEVLDAEHFLLNRQPVSASALLATLHGVYNRRPDKIIQVAGHNSAKYQDVLSAMDVARSAGARVVSMPPSESYPR